VDDQHVLTGKQMLKYLGMRSRDNARTPMQWDASANAGFSTHTPWIKANASYPTINVEQALADPNSIFYYYQKLIRLRHTLPVITDGTYALVAGNEDDEQVYAYTRQNATTTLLVILNDTQETLSRHYDVPADARVLIGNYPDDQGDTLRPYEAKVYQF